MFANLFASDKAPYILTLTVAILSWFITTIISNISDVTVVSITMINSGRDVTYEIANYSVKQSVKDGTFRFTCRAGNCFEALTEQDGTKNFVEVQHVPPYAIHGSGALCTPSAQSIIVRLSLPPGAKAHLKVRPIQPREVEAAFTGIGQCPDSSSHSDPANMWIYTGCSITLFFIRFYFQILVCLLLLTIVFLFYLLMRPSPAATDRAPNSMT